MYFLHNLDDKIEVVTKQQELLRRQEVPGEFFIGADEDEVRAMQKEEKKKYFALLSADNRTPHAPPGPPSGSNHTQGPLQSRIKVKDPSVSKSNVLTGLLIGRVILHCIDTYQYFIYLRFTMPL